MNTGQGQACGRLAGQLTAELKRALARRDTTLLGVVLNVLLAWPDTCFRSETVKHPRTPNLLAVVPSLFSDFEIMPKQRDLLQIRREDKAVGRQALHYSVYTGTRDTPYRFNALLDE